MNQYAAVIQMVIEDNPGVSPAELTNAIIKSVVLADRIMQRMGPVTQTAPAKPTNLIQMPPASPGGTQPAVHEMIKQMMDSPGVGATSAPVGIEPPVAGFTEDAEQKDVDHWESRTGKHDGPERLRQSLAGALPGSIEITVPGVDEPVSLRLGLSAPGHPMTFVRISYTIPGQDIGPTVTVTTADKQFFPEKIIDEIKQQAACSYGKDRKAVQPRTPAPIAPPTEADFARMAVNGDAVHPLDVVGARETAAAWESTRDPKYR